MTFAKLSKKQKEVFKWCYRNQYKAIICDGAVRSGKTICMITSFIFWAMKRFNGAVFGICGKSVGSAERNIIMPLQSIADITHCFKINYTRSVHLLTIEGKNSKNYFYVFGGKDASSYQLIQGITLSGIFLDEVALMPQNFVEQAITRTLSVENSLYWFNCNPDSPEHWFYKEWILQADSRKALHIHFLMSDNPILSQKQLDEADLQFSGVFHDRYIKGLWVNATGIIYRQFADNKDLFIIDSCPELSPVVAIGIDYGAGKSKTSFKAVGFGKGFDNVYILDEMDSDGVYDPESIYRLFQTFYNKIVAQYKKCHFVFGDWGGLGNTINKGLFVFCKKNNIPVSVQDCTKGTILERIELESQLFAQHRLFVLSHCKNMISAFSDAMWDDKKPDTRLDDGTTDIDSLDAFEYAVFPFADKLLLSSKY